MTPIRSVNRTDTITLSRGRSHAKTSLLSPQQRRLVIVTIVSTLYWLVIATFPNAGGFLTIGLIGILIIVMIPWLGQRRYTLGFAVIAYLAALQPAIRLYGRSLPYNVLEYLIPFWLVLFIGKQRGRLYASVPLLLFATYLFIELTGLLVAESLTFGRAVFVPSLVIFCFIFLAAQNSLQRDQLEPILQGYLVGAISLAGLLGRIVFFDETVQWATESNSAASGGMGPNQVTFLLATAIFFILVLSENRSTTSRLVYFALAGVLIYLMILTFSRGGLYMLAITVITYYLLFRRPTVRSLLAIATVTGLVWLVFNLGVERTGGAILDRYNDTATTRLLLAQQGWQIFLDNPILGVGTGNYYIAISSDDLFGIQSGAHNELIRAAAEHGIFGLVTWIIFLLGSVIHAWRNSPVEHRALRIALVILAFTSMLYNGLKLVAQSFVLFVALSAYALPLSRMKSSRLRPRVANPRMDLSPLIDNSHTSVYGTRSNVKTDHPTK